MNIPIISDIHGNCNFYDSIKGAEFVICLGDYAGSSGKNHDSNRCIEILKYMKGEFLLGNHDIEVIGNIDEDDLSFVIDNVEYRYDFNLLQDNKEWLRRKMRRSFKAELLGRSLLFIHSYIKEGYFQYLDSNKIICEFMDTIDRHDSIMFVGHTHVPGLYSLSREGMFSRHKIVYDKWLSLEGGRKFLINVGSVGEPRDGRKNGTYALLNTENMNIMFREVMAVL